MVGSTTALLSLSDAVIPDGPQVTEPSERPALFQRTHLNFNLAAEVQRAEQCKVSARNFRVELGELITAVLWINDIQSPNDPSRPQDDPRRGVITRALLPANPRVNTSRFQVDRQLWTQ